MLENAANYGKIINQQSIAENTTKYFLIYTDKSINKKRE